MAVCLFAAGILSWLFLASHIVGGYEIPILTNFPLTTNLSAWYAGSGFAAVLSVLGLAGFGFYTSQAGRFSARR